MRIHLFNYYHNGDLFLNEPIIRNLCKNNPNHTFTMFCNYNSYIFKDIPNLTISLQSPYPNGCQFYYFSSDILVINLWIYALSYCENITSFNLSHLECNLPNYVIAFKRMLEYIYTNHHIKINFDEFFEDILPVVPDTDISQFIKWYNRRTDKKLVFYYNYSPKSGQTIPFDHDRLVINLANNFPNYIFIVPKFTEIMCNYINNKGRDSSNIISCEEKFNCIEDITCENLCKIQKIIEQCDYSIHYDIGACFYYCNKSTLTSKNIPIHISINSFYYNNLTSISLPIKNKTKLLIANNNNEAYLKLHDILSN